MDGAGDDPSHLFKTPSRVSLAPLPTPSRTRRSSLSALCSAPSLPPARKGTTAWISLQGRLVGAEEATSCRAVSRGVGAEEGVAWDLFSPMQRVLVVAVVATAAKESRKGRTIAKLQRSVEIRDEVLHNMQKKLDDLCEQMNSSKDQPIAHSYKVPSGFDESRESGKAESKGVDFCSCGHTLPQLNPESGIPQNLSTWSKDDGTESSKFEMFKNSHINMTEPEERRMSDLSVFSSVSSSVDMQLSTLAEGQDLYNLRKECEEKDAIIKELTSAVHVSIIDSKRSCELEEIIRRKNMIITRLKKDMVVLEQKVMQLTRQRRHSTGSKMGTKPLPTLATNILYDMSSTSPSSSDSDTPVQQKGRPSRVSVECQSQSSTNSLNCSSIPAIKTHKHRSVSPVKENQSLPRANSSGVLKPKSLASVSAHSKRTSRRTLQESNCATPQKRWV